MVTSQAVFQNNNSQPEAGYVVTKSVDEAVEKRHADAIFIVTQDEANYRADFKQWLSKNFHVYLAFEDLATKIFNKGFKRYSSKTIVETIRYHSSIKELQGEYRINNNTTPDLARLFDAMNPRMSGMFEFRLNSQHGAKPRTSRGRFGVQGVAMRPGVSAN
jgi:hypothetical protein